MEITRRARIQVFLGFHDVVQESLSLRHFRSKARKSWKTPDIKDLVALRLSGAVIWVLSRVTPPDGARPASEGQVVSKGRVTDYRRGTAAGPTARF